MAATSDDIVKMLRQRRIIASSDIINSLASHDDPSGVLDTGTKIDFHKGVLNDKIFAQLTEMYHNDSSRPNLSSSKQEIVTTNPSADLGRVIAPIAAPEPLDIQFRNNLPDWQESDYSCLAVDAPDDLSLIHI